MSNVVDIRRNNLREVLEELLADVENIDSILFSVSDKAGEKPTRVFWVTAEVNGRIANKDLTYHMEVIKSEVRYALGFK